MLVVATTAKPYFENDTAETEVATREEGERLALAFVQATPWSFAEVRTKIAPGVYGEQHIEFDRDEKGVIRFRHGFGFAKRPLSEYSGL